MAQHPIPTVAAAIAFAEIGSACGYASPAELWGETSEDVRREYRAMARAALDALAQAEPPAPAAPLTPTITLRLTIDEAVIVRDALDLRDVFAENEDRRRCDHLQNVLQGRIDSACAATPESALPAIGDAP